MNTAAVENIDLVESWENNLVDRVHMKYANESAEVGLTWGRKFAREGVTLGSLLQQYKAACRKTAEVRRKAFDFASGCELKACVNAQRRLFDHIRYMHSPVILDTCFDVYAGLIAKCKDDAIPESVRLSDFVLDCRESFYDALRRGIFHNDACPAIFFNPYENPEARYARYEQYISDIDALCARADREFGWTSDLIEQFMELINTAKADKMHLEFGKFGLYFDQANRHAVDLVFRTVAALADYE